jgi:type IV pilus assembly protein PilY1
VTGGSGSGGGGGDPTCDSWWCRDSDDGLDRLGQGIKWPTPPDNGGERAKPRAPRTQAWGDAYDMTTFSYVHESSDNAYGPYCNETSSETGQTMETCYNSTNQKNFDWRVRSSSLNVMFFNPKVDYQPWVNYADASFSAALSDPVPGHNGYTDVRDLDGFTYHYWIDDSGFSGNQPNPDGSNRTTTPNYFMDQWDSNVRVTVSAGGAVCDLQSYSPDANGLNLTVTRLSASDAQCVAAMGINSSTAELQQNIANWYQYYRRRSLAAKAAVGRVVTDQPDFRYGLNLVNNSGNFVEMPSAGTTDYLAHNQALIQAYENDQQQPNSTPLRNALARAGRYYEGSLGRNSPIINACQENFTILFTDGFWNGPDPSSPSGDYDGDGGSIGGENTLLADVSKYYYDRDLATQYANIVPTDSWDTASHQHMVTYTIGFGVNGNLVDTDKDGWPNNFDPWTHTGPWYAATGSDDQKKVDDLWHTAWNGRGDYFSARNPTQIAQAFGAAITLIGNRVGSGAAASGNGGSISVLSQLFQAKFDSSDWHGELRAIQVDSQTGALGSENWEAGAGLNAMPESWFLDQANGRRIFTYQRTINAGVPFTWASLNTAQQTVLNVDPDNGAPDTKGEARVAYLRGSKADEGGGHRFRPRQHRLGDLVHSNLEYAAAPPYFYPLAGYQAFASAHALRGGVVYAGANDGMLHAFREDTGAEIFAYVPNDLMPKLNKLTSRNYEHEFFVDGGLTYGDASVSGAWKSVLAGTLRAGGQAVYALDVTDPLNFDASDVLWEFTDEDDPDLGNIVGEPQIKLMQNGKWAVIVTSGYNNTVVDGPFSATGASYVFVLFIEDGIDGWSSGDYVKIPISGADGLAVPAVADVDGDVKADFMYVGDLNGKLWKIDVSDASAANWSVAFSGQPLFSATSSTGAAQSITVQPAVKTHPFGIAHGALVLFGTGKYLEVADDTTVDMPTQTIYGIWDYGADPLQANSAFSNVTRGDLVSQSISLDATSGKRIITGATAPQWYDADGNPDDKGWMVDLPTGGERVVQKVILRDDQAFLVTLIPEADQCTPGSTGWLMVLNAETGAAPVFPVFDINDDLVIDDQDQVAVGDPLDPDIRNPVGVAMPSMPNLPAFLYDDRPMDLGAQFPPSPNSMRGCGSGGARAYTYTTQADGNLVMIATAAQPLICGRQSWMEQE